MEHTRVPRVMGTMKAFEWTYGYHGRHLSDWTDGYHNIRVTGLTKTLQKKFGRSVGRDFHLGLLGYELVWQ